jgi:Flp pilus assembly protein TadD
MWALADLGRTQEAVSLARELAARPPQAAHAAAYGELMVRLGLWEEADAAFTRALQAAAGAGRDPDWRLLFARGAARNELARWPEAEADLLAALPSAPNDPELLNYLGYSWVERGERLEEALAMIQRAVLARPGSGAIVDSLGWAYFRLGEFEQATAFLERAVELEPADPLLNDHLGDAYWRTGRRLEARLQWRRALSLSPGEALRLDLERKLEAGLPEGASEP